MIRTGCCGFSTSLNNYFKEFKLVEVQKTFYKPPKVETALKWREKAPDDFEFTVKAWQVITHPPGSPTYRKAGLRFRDSGFFKPIEEVFNAWEKTKEIAEALKSKIVVFQTPASFKETDENIENMKAFFSTIESKFIHVWEPRGWRGSSIRKICDSLEIIHCTDPFVSEPLCGKIAYFRLHGSHSTMYKHKYSDEELQWLRDFVSSFEKDVYVLFNNIHMREDAGRFIQLIRNSRN